MIADKFRGLGTALVTPFKADGSLDEYGLEKLVTLQIEGGVDFLVPCGTTGENPALTQSEHLRVVELVIRRANGKVPVLAGAGSNSTEKAVDLALAARDLGADGILSITPFYNKPNPDGLLRHFEMQADAIEDMPMILYNVPGRTGLNMLPATTLRIARAIPNVVGVKEASANLEQILQILRDRLKDFLVLSGDDAWTLPLIAAGADGVISVASNEIPKLMSEMVDAAMRDDFATARPIHERILPLMTGNFIESNPIPVKAVLKMLGIIGSDTVRLPLAAMSEENYARMRNILAELKLQN
ncbi:MAG: 4-hydroxy-tetrahydrodipicolinate synthase [Acidobacteria bacterium]|nr:4-hydroxy-tetrahydrodipicolinate synthase [Acidobacteriota bacterium]